MAFWQRFHGPSWRPTRAWHKRFTIRSIALSWARHGEFGCVRSTIGSVRRIAPSGVSPSGLTGAPTFVSKTILVARLFEPYSYPSRLRGVLLSLPQEENYLLIDCVVRISTCHSFGFTRTSLWSSYCVRNRLSSAFSSVTLSE